MSSHQASRTKKASPRRRAPTYPGAQLDADIVAILNAAEVPLSAYELTHALGAQGRRISVVSMYRALERLCGVERVERVEMTARFRIRDVRDAVLLTCTVCERTTAIEAGPEHHGLAAIIAAIGFVAGKIAVEAQGLCRSCREYDDVG